jgi:hypothetical protein
MDEFKKFVGQPLLSQILDVIPSTLIQHSSKKHQADYSDDVDPRSDDVDPLSGFSVDNVF